MTSGIECRGCGGDCRFCDCEYQQRLDREAKEQTNAICRVLDEHGIRYTREGDNPWDVHVSASHVASRLAGMKLVEK